MKKYQRKVGIEENGLKQILVTIKKEKKNPKNPTPQNHNHLKYGNIRIIPCIISKQG